MSERVLIIGSARSSTGFGRVVRSLAGVLHQRYEIHVLGYDVWEDAPNEGWALHPGSRVDVFGVSRLKDLHDYLRPDLVLIVNDYWFLPAFQRVLKQCRHRSAVVAYVPVDARPIDREIVRPLGELDGLAVYTAFARRTLLDVYAGVADVPAALARMEVIPHGTSTDLFHPLCPGSSSLPTQSERMAAREALLGERQPEDSFWVLNANKNSLRKRLDLTLAGFALFARNKPASVRLYLHAGQRDTGRDVQRLARNLNLGERLIVSAHTPEHPVLSLERLNLLFNACEVGLNTSVGEGWGLVNFEHAATGAAQVVPRHSAFAELWSGAAVFVEPVATVPLGSFLEGQEVAPEDIAAALEKLYTDRAYLAHMARAAYTNSTRPEWSWTRIAGQWERFFQRVLATRKHTLLC